MAHLAARADSRVPVYTAAGATVALLGTAALVRQARRRRDAVSRLWLVLVDVRSTVLSVDEVLAAVEDPAAGGVVSFTGLVRASDGGQAVTRLEYSAHPSAADEMTQWSTRRSLTSCRWCESLRCTGSACSRSATSRWSSQRPRRTAIRRSRRPAG